MNYLSYVYIFNGSQKQAGGLINIKNVSSEIFLLLYDLGRRKPALVKTLILARIYSFKRVSVTTTASVCKPTTFVVTERGLRYKDF